MDRAFDAFGQRAAVGQARQRVECGEPHDLTVQVRHRAGQKAGARIEPRQQQRDDQNGKRKQDHRGGEPLGVHALGRTAHGAERKLGGRHTGVMHAADRDTHHQRRAETLAHHMAFVIVAERTRHPQRGGRRANRDRERAGEPGRVIVDGRVHLHRSHAGVVHAGDAEAHQHAAGHQPGRREPCMGCRDQCQIRRADPEPERTSGRREVVAERNRQREGEHRDEVHRPDPDTERRGAAQPPRVPQTCRRQQEDAAGQIERGVRRQHRDGERDGDQPKIV